jgi:signal transduction histidine kinase/DNA-binding response OmpR family regulator
MKGRSKNMAKILSIKWLREKLSWQTIARLRLSAVLVLATVAMGAFSYVSSAINFDDSTLSYWLVVVLLAVLFIVANLFIIEKFVIFRLQRSMENELTQIMVDATPYGVTFWNKDCQAFETNSAILKLYELSSKEEWFERFHELAREFQPDGERSDEKAFRHIRQAFAEGYARFYFLHHLLSGEELPVEVTLIRATYRNEYIVLGYARDLREEQAYIAEARKARQEAEAANSAKSVFLANMSHEIRTPMNSIIGFAELAQDDDNPPATRDYLKNIEESAKLLLTIIDDVLDISKIEAGKMELENIPFDIHDIFAYCRIVILPKALEKGVTLFCYAEPSVKNKLLGDPVRLRQVLLNMLSNAVKFTNAGSVKLSAVVAASDESTVTIHFEVKDSGIGMKPEQMARIFEPFVQADESVSRKYGGTGLGLTITKSFIEMMGGQLEVESAPGLGTKFSFDVKFDVLSAPIMDTAERVVFHDIKKPTFKGEVLICEDNYMNQQVICAHFARVGLDTVVAGDGQEGVDLVAARLARGEKPFDLIFMDIHMPAMDGLEAAAQIAEMGVQTPIVALTANIMVNELDLYRQSGMSDHIGKPFTSQQLWSCLLHYLTPLNGAASEGQGQDEDALLLARMKEMFCESNQTTFAEIQKAIDRKNIKLAHRLAHTLKTNAAHIGETNLQEAAFTVERALVSEENQLTEEQMKILENELNMVLVKLK